MAELAEGEPAATTYDAFLGGRLMLRQPARGHRAGTDAILLAAAVPTCFSGMVHDVGAGTGAAGLALATRCPKARVQLIENDPATVALAAINIAANKLSRVSLCAEDAFSTSGRHNATQEGRADVVITNPPFYNAESFRLSPDAGRRKAHVMPEAGLAGWVRACLDLLGAKGSLVVIHRAEAALALIAALGKAEFGLTLLPVYAHADGEATRVLLRAVKGSRAPLRVASPLVLHDDDGAFTTEAERLHRGESVLRW